MAKDPAFLFYHHDFLIGTEFMSHEQVGCYIRILCHMADKGHLSKERMLHVCGTCVLDKRLEEKFKIDENGLYYNIRLDFEVSKRKNFCESRRLSRMSNVRETHVERTVNVNRNVNRNKKPTKLTNPTIEEVRAYCLETKSPIDPDYFFSNYESQGWIKANGLPIKNWKLTIKTWEKKQEGKNATTKRMLG